MTGRAYTSTVVAPVQIALAVVAAIAVVIPTALVGASPWIAVLVGIVVVATGVHLSTVRLSVVAERILLGQGPWGRPARSVAASEVVDAASTSLSWAQVFGIGVRFHRRTTRLTVRPGPTLCLTLRSGEHIRISTPDPESARRLLPAAS